MSPGRRPAVDVVAAILWQGGRYLAVSRPPGKAMAGFWEFPGGKIEPGETAEVALVREIREELDVTPVTFAFFKEKEHSYDHITVRLHFFHVHGFAGTPKALEGQTLEWLSPREALSKPFLEADREIVEELAQGG